MSESVAAAVAQLDTATRGHHPDSPSSLQASEACPQFENEQRESAASAAGTLQHKAAETRDLSILDGDPDMENAVTKCLEYEDAVIDAATNRDGVKPDIYREVYLPVGDDIARDKDGNPHDGITGGYPDTIVAGTREADILDWKFGKVPVTETKNNLQGIAYSLALMQLNPQLDAVTVHFFAPYQGFSMQEQYSKYVHRFTRADMPAMELRIRTVIARKKDPSSPAHPRNDLCIWCAKKSNCKALHAVVLKPTAKYSDFVVPEVVDPLQLSRAEQVHHAVVWSSQVTTIASAIKKRATEMVLTEGLELGDDMKLVRRQERTVKDRRKLIEIAKQHGFTDEQFWELLLVPLTKIEESIKKLAPKGQGAAAIRAFKQELEESGVTELGKPVHFLQEVKSPADKAKPVIEVIADEKRD